MLLMQLSAAHGPAECEYAVQLTLRKLLQACAAEGLAVEVMEEFRTAAGYKSVLLRCERETPALREWLGTIQWIFASPLRPHHPRKNWFVAIQRCEPPRQLPMDGERSSSRPARLRAKVASMSTPRTPPFTLCMWPAALRSRS